MFCKKCGTEIKEGQAFCPKCGTQTGVTKSVTTGAPGFADKMYGSGKSEPAGNGNAFLDKAKELGKKAYEGLEKGADAVTEATDKGINVIRDRKRKGFNPVGLIIGFVGTIALVLALVFIIRAVRMTPVGVWKPDTSFGGSISKSDFDLTEPEELLAYTLLNLADNGRLVLDKDGTLLLATSGKRSLGLGLMSYEKESRSSLRFKVSVNIPVIGDISASLRCNYKMKNPNTMILTVEGHDIYFVRAKGEKAKEYVAAAKEGGFSFSLFGEDSELGNKLDEFGNTINGYKDQIEDYGQNLKDNIDWGEYFDWGTP